MYLTVPTAVSTASVFSIGLECATGTCSHSHSHSRSRAQRYPNISLLPRRADVLWASPLVASPPLPPPPLSLSLPPAPPLPAPCPGTGHCQCYVTRRDAASSSFYLSGVPKSAVFFFFFFFFLSLRPLNRIGLTPIATSATHFRQHPRETSSG